LDWIIFFSCYLFHVGAQIDNREKFLNLNVEEMEQIIPNVSNLRENFQM